MTTANSNYARDGKKVAVVIPAYRAERTIERAYREIPSGAADMIFMVDDASPDGTAARARELGIETLVQPRNGGYGATQKRCYSEALARGADIVVMLHADAQYDARVIPEMTEILARGEADMVLGSRMKAPGGARRGGMPPLKIFVNRALTVLQNYVFGTRLTDMHTGYRAYTRRCLELLPIEDNADGFLFDSQVLAQAAALGLRIEEVAVESRYFSEASSIGFFNGAVYTFGTLVLVLRFVLHRRGVVKYNMFRNTVTDTIFPDKDIISRR